MQKRLELARLVRASLGSKSLWRGGASALALSAIAVAQPAIAQEQQQEQAKETAATTPENLQEVVVTGLRRSLESAQEIKKNAEVFVDSITSEDIGALPDRSVTEALQRIPGVAISRFAAGNDPDHFSIEGSGVVVRGLPQVRSEINGRDTFSANSGRFLSFSDVPPELLGGVDVYKNQSAEMIEGGLAGSVNLRTLVPFDVDGQRIAASLEANYGDFAEETTPTGSALYTNRWSVGEGEIGVLLSGAYSQLKSRSDGLQISSFQRQARDNLFGANNPVWVPEGAAFRSQDYDRERIGVAAAFQWQNGDRTKVLTVQGLRSDATTKWTETGSEIATDVDGGNGNLNFALVDGYDAGYDEDTGLFTHGVITTDAGWKEDQRHDGWGTFWGANAREGRSPLWGLPSNNLLRGVNQEYMTQDVGANFKWKLNDNWGFTFDLQHVESTVTNLDMSMWTANFQNVDIDLRGSLPVVRFISPLQNEAGQTLGPCTVDPNNGQLQDWGSGCTSYMGAANPNLYDPYNNYWRAAMDHAEDSEGDENALKFDIDRAFDNAGIIKSVKFGGRWSKREQDIRSSTWNWGALAETWGGRGPVWLNDPVDGIPTTTTQAGIMTAAPPACNPDCNPHGYTGLPGTNGVVTGSLTYVDTFDNFMRGKVPVPSAMRLYGSPITSQSGYNTVSDLAEMIGEEWRPYINDDGVTGQHWVRLANRPGTVGDSMFLPNEIHSTEETVKSAYAMIKFGSDEGAEGVTFSGNVGLRWVRTDFLSLGTINAPTTPFPTEGQCTPPVIPDPMAPVFVPPTFCERFPTQAARDAVRPFANGATGELNADSDYDSFLPSFNLKVNLTDEFLMRFGFSKAMARPDLGLTRNFFNVAAATDFVNPNNPALANWWGLRASTGNGYLKPVRSTQFDLSGEWYFSSVGQLTATLFYKQLKDVWTNGYYTADFTNNGVTLPVVVAAPINSDEKGMMRGFELAYQQFFDMLPGFWSGFGIQANYTYIDSQGVPQAILDSAGTGGTAQNVPNVNTKYLPLVNLSKDNINFQLMYAKGPLDARIAYSWRSKYLLTVRDVITPFSPIMNEASGQLDASVMYSINDNFKIGFQAVNLTDEIVQTSQVLEADEDHVLTGPRSWFLSDRRVSAIFRMSF
jgi:TonB-dependent receptor